MHQIIFYPVGNGDTSQIVLENGKRILMDYCHRAKSEDDDTPEINLKERLLRELKDAKKRSFDVVAFTHGDDDHLSNSTDFFELRHADKYKGGDRVPVDELWVPAAMVLDDVESHQRTADFALWRAEARHRLREGTGIRVFSKPEKLKDWLASQGLTVESRRDLITDAGQLAPGFSLDNDGVEFFCHSPFIRHVDDGDDLRNSCALIFNVRLRSGGTSIDYLAVGDSEWVVLEEIVETTQRHANDDRLRWDLFNIPHHCSYLALSDVKGDVETEPKPKIKELLQLGQPNCYIVSSSNPILSDSDAHAQIQPPHVQAKTCYERHLREIGGGRLLVTMAEPNTRKPEPLVFRVDADGISREQARTSAAATLISREPPRAGSCRR